MNLKALEQLQKSNFFWQSVHQEVMADFLTSGTHLFLLAVEEARSQTVEDWA